MDDMAAAQAESNRHRKDNRPKPTQPFLYSLKIGFFAGVIWGLVRWLATGLNFTEVTQAFLLDPFVPRKVLGGFYWQASGWFMFIVMSVLAAWLYLLLLGRLQGPWPGLLFGAAWWGIFYALAGPAIGAVPPLKTIGWNSMATDFCLFLVWGLFIGYSIAFELHNEAKREPATKKTKGSEQPSS
jgi:hypothetical protein